MVIIRLLLIAVVLLVVRVLLDGNEAGRGMAISFADGARGAQARGALPKG
ncbi:hypothetical protein ACIA74_44155 [Streptomyces sp. NPDC051658]|nr:hypothetical protein OG520_38190 [Streptomyces sp. NBC_00984]